MNYRPPFFLASFGRNALSFALAAWRRPSALLVLLAAFGFNASAQSWSSFIDSSRAVDWSKAGFTIPNYSTNCSTQPSLLSGSSPASANASSILKALASCDSSHNVVNIPAGTWYVGGITYPSHGQQVLRGAGPTATRLILPAWPAAKATTQASA